MPTWSRWQRYLGLDLLSGCGTHLSGQTYQQQSQVEGLFIASLKSIEFRSQTSNLIAPLGRKRHANLNVLGSTSTTEKKTAKSMMTTLCNDVEHGLTGSNGTLLFTTK